MAQVSTTFKADGTVVRKQVTVDPHIKYHCGCSLILKDEEAAFRHTLTTGHKVQVSGELRRIEV